MFTSAQNCCVVSPWGATRSWTARFIFRRAAAIKRPTGSFMAAAYPEMVAKTTIFSRGRWRQGPSRNRYRWIFPVAVFGSSRTKWICFGTM